MDLTFARSLQLSLLLPYGSNSSKNLSGINIIIQNPAITSPLGNHQRNDNSVSLLASFLANADVKYNLISLEGDKSNEVIAVINVADDKADSFKKKLKQNFKKLKENLHNDTKLLLESIPPINYHIIDGSFIFELINKLNEKVNRLRDRTGTKLVSVCELMKISSGEPFNSLSDLEIDLHCWSDDETIIKKIWSKIYALGRAYKLSVI